MNKLTEMYLKYRMNPANRAEFYKKISSFLDDGIPLDDIIKRMSGVYKKDTGLLSFLNYKIYLTEKIESEMKQAKTFSESIAPFCPPSEFVLINSGESQGGLSDAMRNAITMSESLVKIRQSLISGLTYPFVLIMMLILMIVMFALKVIPQLAAVIPPDTWTGNSARLYALSEFVMNDWYKPIIVLIALIALIKITIKRKPGGFREYIDLIPPYSIYKVVSSASFLISVSSMLKTGVDFESSVRMQSNNNSDYNISYIEKILDRLRHGYNDGEALKVKYLSKTIEEDIDIYGDTSDFQKVIELLGNKMVEDTINNVKKITSLLNSLSIAALGGFIAWAYYSFYMLTQSIAQSAGV